MTLSVSHTETTETRWPGRDAISILSGEESEHEMYGKKENRKKKIDNKTGDKNEGERMLLVDKGS